MHAKTAMILGWFAASYGLLLLWGATSAPLAVVLTISVSLAIAGIGFSVMHDANHGAYSRSPRVNRAWGLALDFVGASSYVWRFKHNVQHHTTPNLVGLDADIDIQPFVRLSPFQAWRPWHRYQHLYVWFLYALLAIKWRFVDDFKDVLTGRLRARFLHAPHQVGHAFVPAEAVLGEIGCPSVVMHLVNRIPMHAFPAAEVHLG